MLTKQKLLDLRSLHQRKAVLELNCFLAEGEKLVKEALAGDGTDVIELISTEEWLSNHSGLINEANVSVVKATMKQISQISSLVTPQEVIAVCKVKPQVFNSEKILNTVSLYFHEMRDPGNAGTILRIADWFGISDVYTSPESVFRYNPKLVQSSMGSIFRVGYHTLQIEQIKALKDKLPIYATALEGESIYKGSKMDRAFIMFGSESHGLPAELMNLSDKKITIPRASGSNAESLNLAVSAGIILSHIL